MSIKKVSRLPLLFSILTTALFTQSANASSWLGWIWGGNTTVAENKLPETAALPETSDLGANTKEKEEIKIDSLSVLPQTFSAKVDFTYKTENSSSYTIEKLKSLQFQNSSLKELLKVSEMLFLLEYQLISTRAATNKEWAKAAGTMASNYRHIINTKYLNKVSDNQKSRLAKEITKDKLLEIKRSFMNKDKPYDKFMALKIAADAARNKVINILTTDNQNDEQANTAVPVTK